MSDFRVVLVDLSKFVFPHTDVFHALFLYIRFHFHGQSVEFAHGLIGERMFRLFSVVPKTWGTSVEHPSVKFVGGVCLVTVSVLLVSGTWETYFTSI